MSDTRIERAICEAIQIIADKKIAQASFDKTIKAVVSRVLDATTGKYEIRYQDSLFQAYATSSEVYYQEGRQVFVLIPGNDWDRTKTILNGVSVAATTYKEIPSTSDLYNAVGGNLVDGSVNLCSYQQTFMDLYVQGGSSNLIEVDQQSAKRYIKQGDSLALGMVVRTELADSQIGGNYGLVFNLRFKDNQSQGAAVRSYVVDTRNVNGNPYGLTKATLVEALIESIDTDNFDGIESIQAFCQGFPSGTILTPDIFISDIKLNGATALTEDQLNGYILHIDYSQDGNVLGNGKSIVTLVAQLKVNGKIITDNVKYYWFKQNGMIFRGSDKYSGYGGDGWECLNYYLGSSAKPAVNSFKFTSNKDNVSNTTTIITALAVQKITKVKCVAVYGDKEWITGETEVINNNIISNIYISSSDLKDDSTYQTVYYLDAGSPTLTCNTEGLSGSLTYTWAVTPANGRMIQKANTTSLNTLYTQYKTAYDNVVKKAGNMAVTSATAYKKTSEYDTAVKNWNGIKNKERIDGKYYVNFPVSSITNYSKITCAVQQDGEYRGTASIILYNKMQLQGMYSLNLENGTQVFQYDGKGNSPASPQLEKPIEIQALGFTLLDNQGKEISHQQIKNNGVIRWLIPKTSTLLQSKDNGDPVNPASTSIVIGADIAFAADYYIYKDLDFFSYSIANNYDAKCVLNYIRLNVTYKDMVFDAYTDFTFPKDGDPGTNGTDYIAKLSPSTTTDRVYISNRATSILFDDDGATVDKLNFQLYNNSRKLSASANLWTCPPRINTSDKVRGNTYINCSNGVITAKNPLSGKTIADAVTQIRSDKPIDIVRAQNGTGNDVKYYAEYPVCYNFVNGNYRIKVKPKTGFKYAVYAQDGTSPDYDNTLPFEIVVEQSSGGYYITGLTGLTYAWYAIGNIQIDSSKTATGNKRYYKPKNTFDGSDLTSAIVCKVAKDGTDIGLIHIPIYMIINRYGHAALNSWDGNSIQLNANGDTILAPQIGAGKKDTSSNTFTGIFMGDVKDSSGKQSIGLMGYHNGQRSIFLDAETGKAQFGKQGKAQIILDPTSDKAQLYSGNYSITNKTGMLIDLTTPEIKFGSGNFSVTKDGYLTAKGGGSIANWKISDDALTSQNNQVYLRSSNYTTTYPYAIYSNGTFTVTPAGYMTSTSGKIAKWSIDANALTDGNVGMGQGKTITANTFNNQTSTITNARIWANNVFAVDNNGKVWANSGQIGPWELTKNELTDGNTGLGTKSISAANMNSAFGVNAAKAARIWSLGTAGSDSTVNFIVTNTGQMYSKTGKIGGWNITGSRLYAVGTSGKGIRLNSNGSMNGGAGYSGGSGGSWSINEDGSSSFTNINTNYMTATNANVTGNLTATTLTANRSGTIGGFTIGSTTLTGGNLTLSSAGSMSGPHWSISSNGTAYFGQIYGTIADGQELSVPSGTSVGSLSGDNSWSMPGSGVPSWNSKGTNMTPQDIKVVGRLALRMQYPASGSGFSIPSKYTTKTVVTSVVKHTSQATIEGGGSISYISDITVNTTDIYAPSGYVEIDKVCTGWTSDTALKTVKAMISVPGDQSIGEG